MIETSYKGKHLTWLLLSDAFRWQQVARAAAEIFTSQKQEAENIREMIESLWSLKACPSDTPPSTRPHLLILPE